MRRFLAHVAAVCVAPALVVPLWAAAPATTGAQAPTPDEGHVFGDQEHGDQGHGLLVQRETPEETDFDGGRFEAEHSFWTYVDRAFPDQAYDGAEPEGVGTGRLEWDHVHTRRALFRFPIEPGIGAAVDSVTLRTEVTWSYDCGGASHVQLHRVDPFDAGVTWNDQPTSRDLLDTRNVQGGKPACPVVDGVEFDVTEAYRWAVERGQSHLHLRLRERDESGNAGWRRFDVQDRPPVLVIDHGAPTASSEARYRLAHAPEPLLPESVPGGGRFDQGGAEKAVLGPEPFLGARERTRSQGWEGSARPSASSDRRPGQSTFPRARGPPITDPDHIPVRRSQGIGHGDGTPILPTRPSTGRRNASTVGRAPGRTLRSLAVGEIFEGAPGSRADSKGGGGAVPCPGGSACPGPETPLRQGLGPAARRTR